MNSRFIDLTMSMDENTPVYPGTPQIELKQTDSIEKDGWNSNMISFSSHFGTHIDAPFHMLENGKTLDDFPIDKFIGHAIVINIRNPDLRDVKENDIVFFYTEGKDIEISKEIAEKLIQKKIKIFGIDALSPDKEPFEIHKMFFRNNILIVENLVNLKELIGKRFECFILPLKIKHADGAPCRVVAKI